MKKAVPGCTQNPAGRMAAGFDPSWAIASNQAESTASRTPGRPGRIRSPL
jgi:hypothetical protein